MRKEEFCYESRDNSSLIHAVRYTPDNGDVKAVVQIIHGMAEHMERYEEFAQYLTDRGYVVTGEDHLGHGRSAGENGFGYFCEQDPATVLVRDVHRLKKLTQQCYPAVPYVILGHSMGSFILRDYLCRYGTGIQGAIVMGTGMQPPILLGMGRMLAAVFRALVGDKHVSKMLEKLAFGAYNRRFRPVRTPVDWLSRDKAKVDRYIEDPMCGFTFTVNGFRTLFELIYRSQRPQDPAKIPGDLPVLMVSGEEDPVGEYGAGVKRAAEWMRASGFDRLTLKLYPGARHEVLNETNRRSVMEDLAVWLEHNIEQQG